MSKKPALRPDMAVGGALRDVAHDVLSDAFAALENSDNSDAIAVHQFRREMKRWRALLRLLEPCLGKTAEDLQATARDLARELGGARDPQSALEAVDDLVEHDLPLPRRTIQTVRKRIDALRAAGETNALTSSMRLRIAEALADAGTAVDHWPLDDLTFPDIAKELAASYRAARRAVPESWSAAGPDELHDLRKRVVIHRYQMQIVEPLWRRFAKMWIAEAQRLRERLGQHQDLEVLRGLTQPQHALAPWRTQLEAPIAARKQRHVAAAKKIAARLFVDKPGAFRRRLMVMWKTS
jgi:CHAD domain-containing protein